MLFEQAPTGASEVELLQMLRALDLTQTETLDPSLWRQKSYVTGSFRAEIHSEKGFRPRFRCVSGLRCCED